MQSQLVQGETLNYRVTVADYPAGDGWVLTLYLNPRSGTTNQQVTGTSDGDDHLLQAASSATALWAAGFYAWEVWAAKAGEAYRIEAGQLEVLASIVGAAAGTDTRSQAQRALDDARAAFAAWTPTTRSYAIGGRQMEFAAAGDILAVISYWENEVRRERNAERARQGLADDRKVYARIGRA